VILAFLGYAPDGGVYVPESLPIIPLETLNEWASESFKNLVKIVCKLFIGNELEEEDINDAVDGGLGTFAKEDALEVQILEDNLMIGETFHGPTMTFKDLALSVVGRLMGKFLKRKERKITVVVGKQYLATYWEKRSTYKAHLATLAARPFTL